MVVPVICPACRAPLAAAPGLPDAAWACAGCGRAYPVRDGVPRLIDRLDAGERQAQRAFDFEHARYRDSRRVHFRAELVDELCDDVRLLPAWFRGKTALDAGCGSGRWSYALAAMGARVVAVDLADAGVRATRAALAPFAGCAVYQASIFALPFPTDSFDFVMSWGVLHHTPDTRAAFDRLVPLVKPGGTLYVMVYERVAWRRRVLTDLLRAALRRLPDELRYRVCRRLVIRDPAWYRRLSPYLKVCDGSAARDALDLSTLVFDTFDAYSPRYNHVHSQREVRRWFFEAGLSDVALTHPVKFTTASAVARWGECGGAVHVRGVRGPSVLVVGDEAGASRASLDLRAAGLVADSPTTGRAWLTRRMARPAPVAPALAGAPGGDERPATTDPAPQRRPTTDEGRVAGAGSSIGRASVAVARAGDRPPFDRPYALPWHGVAFRVPSAWWLRRDGAALAIAPPMAIPPFQLAVHVSHIAAGQPLQRRAAAAFGRWLPPGQRAEVLGQRTTSVGAAAGTPAVERRYALWFDAVQTQATFTWFEHAGRLCQAFVVAAWEADEPALKAAEAAHTALVASIALTRPRRDVASALPELVAGGSSLARALRRTGGRMIGRLPRLAFRALHLARSSGTPARSGRAMRLSFSSDDTFQAMARAYDLVFDLADAAGLDAAELVRAVYRRSAGYVARRRQAGRRHGGWDERQPSR